MVGTTTIIKVFSLHMLIHWMGLCNKAACNMGGGGRGRKGVILLDKSVLI